MGRGARLVTGGALRPQPQVCPRGPVCASPPNLQVMLPHSGTAGAAGSDKGHRSPGGSGLGSPSAQDSVCPLLFRKATGRMCGWPSPCHCPQVIWCLCADKWPPEVALHCCHMHTFCLRRRCGTGLLLPFKRSIAEQSSTWCRFYLVRAAWCRPGLLRTGVTVAPRWQALCCGFALNPVGRAGRWGRAAFRLPGRLFLLLILGSTRTFRAKV